MKGGDAAGGHAENQDLAGHLDENNPLAGADGGGAAAQPARVLGPVQLNATLVNGAVDARDCAFPGPAAAPAAAPSGAAPCTAGERVWATAQGPVGLTTQTYDLRIRAHIDEPKVTDYVAALAE